MQGQPGTCMHSPTGPMPMAAQSNTAIPLHLNMTMDPPKVTTGQVQSTNSERIGLNCSETMNSPKVKTGQVQNTNLNRNSTC